MSDDTDSGAVELDVMLAAVMPIPTGYLFRAKGANTLSRLVAGLRPGGERVQSPCLAFAVRHPSAGTILIDTGLHADASACLRKDFGGPMSLMFRSIHATAPFDEQLRALSIEAATVERVIMTHLHVDHTSGMRLLPKAEFICSREEWATTRARFPVARGYVVHHLPSESRMRLVDFDRDGEAFGAFAKTIDLLGDGSIRLVSTPGHTAGHLSVLLRLTNGRPALIVGDAAYTLRSIREEILPMLAADDETCLRSMQQITAFAKSAPDAILVPTHDPGAWHELPATPDARSARPHPSDRYAR